MPVLLTREQFRERVFASTAGRCVVCFEPAVDPHHIMDRALWPDGGYYWENGAPLCVKHHYEAEMGRIQPSSLRMMMGIHDTYLPPGLDPRYEYDKWGFPLYYFKVISYKPTEIWFTWDGGTHVGVIVNGGTMEIDTNDVPSKIFRNSLRNAIDSFERARIMELCERNNEYPCTETPPYCGVGPLTEAMNQRRSMNVSQR
jgi:hypothetical protein